MSSDEKPENASEQEPVEINMEKEGKQLSKKFVMN